MRAVESIGWGQQEGGPSRPVCQHRAGESDICLKTVPGDCLEISEQAGGAFGRFLEERSPGTRWVVG